MTSSTDTLAYNPSQARVSRNNPTGGEWIDTPTGVLEKTTGPTSTRTRRPAASIVTHEGEVQRGSYMGSKEASQGANPHFQDPTQIYKINCQKAVTAYELRRRGYAVIASPGVPDKHFTESWPRAWVTRVQHVPTSRDYGDMHGAVARRIKMEFPGRTRGALEVWWDKGGGHALSWENRDGTVMFLDPQSGKSAPASHPMWKRLRTSAPITLYQLDDKRYVDPSVWGGTDQMVEHDPHSRVGT